jgi:hypothetical protein
VHPSFLDVVHTFGEKAEPVEESFSTFFYHPLSQYQALSSESSYEDAGYGKIAQNQFDMEKVLLVLNGRSYWIQH